MSESVEKNNGTAKKRPGIKIAVISAFYALIIALLCAVTIFFMWKNGAFLPRYITWNNQEDTYNISEENVLFSLKRKRLKITNAESKELIYKTPKEWLVSDFFVTDIDSDGTDDVIMMVWKQGSFGKYKPFWHDEKDNKWTQHIFIFEWNKEREDRLKPMWMSSGLGIKVHKVYVDEKSRVHFTDDAGEETVWQWINWGLTLVEVIPAK
ncbi:MAG: hypothetical protein IJ141_06190 [Lachnospiraceae bacterium]|nr:hypothetical protein [Lachnospiraceae bacterium]